MKFKELDDNSRMETIAETFNQFEGVVATSIIWVVEQLRSFD